MKVHEFLRIKEKAEKQKSCRVSRKEKRKTGVGEAKGRWCDKQEKVRDKASGQLGEGGP